METARNATTNLDGTRAADGGTVLQPTTASTPTWVGPDGKPKKARKEQRAANRKKQNDDRRRNNMKRVQGRLNEHPTLFSQSVDLIGRGFGVVDGALKWFITPVGAEAAKTDSGKIDQACLAGNADKCVTDANEFVSANSEKFIFDTSKKAPDDRILALIADEHHEHPRVQAELTDLIHSSILPGDVLLVESPSGDTEFLKFFCRSVDYLGATCVGIDNAPATVKLRKSLKKAEQALARYVLSFLNKTIMWAYEIPTVEELVKFGHMELVEMANTHINAMQNKQQKEKFTDDELKKMDKLLQTSTKLYKEWEALLFKTIPAREKWFFEEIEKHVKLAKKHNVFIVLGGQHVDNMQAEFMKTYRGIVARPKFRPE